MDASTARPPDAIESVCPLAAVASSVTYAGQTFVYTGFNNQTGPVPDVVVTAIAGGAEVARTTNDASGNYALTIPSANRPRLVEIDYVPNGYWVTRVLSDRPLDADVFSPNMDRYRLGDGPVWGDGQMGSVYGANPNPYDLAKGTINIVVRDCNDNIVEGAVVSVTPAPETLQYIDGGGFPSTQLTATVAPYTTAIAFNAIAGPTRISVTKDSATYTFDIDVLAGRYMQIPVVHVPQ